MFAPALITAIVLAPFLLLPVAGWLGGRGPDRAQFLALAPAALFGFWISIASRLAGEGPFDVSVPWVPGLGLSLAFRIDGLSALFASLITGIGALVVCYAARYFDDHPCAGRFQLTLFAFMGSMLGVVLSDNLLALFVFWELTSFTSYLLIGFENDRADARAAALQALLVTGAGGLALLGAAVLIGRAGGSDSLSTLLASGTRLTTDVWYAPIASLVLFAAFTKSAQFPFHFWLPNAMRAPTPVSAYLHSATMVKAGVYLVARMSPLLGGTVLWTAALVSAGAATMALGAWQSMRETDLKRILAYSTISALGVLMLLLGAGTPAAVTASLVYLLAHALYKGALFLVAGAVEHESGSRDVTALSGLGRRMPVTAIGASMAAVSMAGVPLLFGFVAKEQFYGALRAVGGEGPWAMGLLVGAVAASALLGAAGLVAGIAPFIGARMAADDIEEPPAALWFGPVVLGGAGLLLGLIPGVLDGVLGRATAAIVQDVTPVSLSLWHGWTVTLASSGATLIGSAALFAARDSLRRLAWPRLPRAEQMYSGLLRTLDALSNAVAPALQGASLRSYALTIVAAVTALVGTALATARVLPALSRWTPMQPHEAGVALLIVCAAVSAAAARSTMGAVLSLGTVGYGVALMYVLFGAPDLAMTQFAIETLTVVIFVLVFRQVHGFGDLSSTLVKVRDALVATVAGGVIAVLVLFIGASGTSSRLAAYFAAEAPARGHGRNVVNVILVDFRGLDTLGEITVLVTVAIGVRALLRIGRDPAP